MTTPMTTERAIDDPHVPGLGTGLTALLLAIVPTAWIAVFLALPAAPQAQEWMLLAEPYVVSIAGALALLIGLAALWRDTRAGRILASLAIGLVFVQTAIVVILLVLG